jgi:hypothetical protein
MGYTSGWSSLKSVKEHILNSQGKDYKVIDHKSTNCGRNLWMAIQEEVTGESFICLYLLSSYDNNWGYKGISEDMGPCECDCPLSLLNKTKGLNNPYSLEWRQKVRKFHAHKKEIATGIEIGEIVSVYGAHFKIVGKVARSYVGIKLSTGMKYKLSYKQIQKLSNSEDFVLNKCAQES